MTDEPGSPRVTWDPPEIDTTVAQAARVYDYLLGGYGCFTVDQQAAEWAYAAWPGGIEGARRDARAHREMLGRMVRWLAAEAGIRQFLDIGSGTPTEGSALWVAPSAAPGARVMCIDHDPVVIGRMHQLIRWQPDVDYRYGELRDPPTILLDAADTLDLSQPVAVLLLGVLHHLCPRDHPAHLIGQLMRSLAAGSYLAVSHLAADIATDEVAETFRRLNERMTSPLVPRTREEVTELLAGLELVPPGIVQPQQWRPEPETPPEPLPAWCGIGRKA